MKKLYKDKGYNLLEKEYNGNKSYMTFEKDGYLYYNTYNGFMKTDNPKKWGKKNPYSLQNIQKWINDNGGTCLVVSKKYDTETINLKCQCGNIYTIAMSNFVATKQFTCPPCGKKRAGYKNRRDNIYLSKAEELGLTLLEEYHGCKSYYYMRTSDDYYIRSSLWNIYRGTNYKDTIFDTCNKYSIENMRHWLKDNSNGVTLLSTCYNGAKERYLFRCSCGKKFETNWQAFRFENINRCPTCSQRQSSLELKTEQWLVNHDIKFEKEKIFKDCRYLRPLKFDYYLPELNIIIEADGKQHEEPVCFGGMTLEQAQENLKTSKIRDSIKDNYCLEHGLKLVRIPYYEFESGNYENILKISTAKS